VEAVLAALPEFEAVGRQAKAAPEIGQRNIVAEFCFEFVETLFQKGTRFDNAALV